MPCETYQSDFIGFPSTSGAGEFARTAAKAFGLPPYLVSQFHSDSKFWGTATAGIELADTTASTDHGHYTVDYRTMTLQSYGLSGECSLYASFGASGASCIACSPSEDVVLTILIAFERLTREQSSR
jgi:hypothetical protein